MATSTPVTPVKKRKKVKAFVAHAQVHIQSTYNNTIVSIADPAGNVLGWSSAGSQGFKGPKKATPYAAGIVVKDALGKVEPYGVKEVDILVKGVGPGREGAIRAFAANGISITTIRDVTPIPHNGPRARKVRRV